MDVILSDQSVNRLEDFNQILKSRPAGLNTLVDQLRTLSKSEIMQLWANGTDAGASIYRELSLNITNLEKTIASINRIAEANNTIIEWNRINNNQSVNT